MIKKTARNDTNFECLICKRVIRYNQQFLLHNSQWSRKTIMHVSCTMQLCGQEVTPGKEWRTQKEIDKENERIAKETELALWLKKAGKAKKQGKSLLDV